MYSGSQLFDTDLHPICYLRGCLHDPALPGCNEAWDFFDVLKIAISCGSCLRKIVS